LVDVKGRRRYFELLKLIFKARLGRYDAVISSGGNKFIAALLWLTGIKTKIGYDTGALSRKLLTHAVALNKDQYACDMYHDLAAPLTDVKTALPEINAARQAPAQGILIHPGVSKLSVEKGMIKTIPPEKWAQIIDLLVQQGKKVTLTGGPDDKECIETILRTATTSDCENKYGKTKSLRDLAELIADAEIFLCSDSAPLHIAVALRVKTFAIFGPTDDTKLIPQADFVTALKTEDDCPLKPCLWARRQTTCEALSCLDFDVNKIVETITA